MSCLISQASVSSPAKWAYESHLIAGKAPQCEFSAQGRAAAGLPPSEGLRGFPGISAHLVGLYGPRLHVQVPDLDCEVIAGEHVPAAVAELHVRHGGNNFREEGAVTGVLGLFKYCGDKNKHCHRAAPTHGVQATDDSVSTLGSCGRSFIHSSNL